MYVDTALQLVNSLVAEVVIFDTQQTFDKIIAVFINKFEAMAISMSTTIQQRFFYQNNRQKNLFKIKFQSSGLANQNKNNSCCNYCNRNNIHDQCRNCFDFYVDQRNDIIHLNKKRFICFELNGK